MEEYVVLSTSPTFTKYSERAAEILEENNCRLVMVPPAKMYESQEFKETLKIADAWVTGINKVKAHDLDPAEKLKIIVKHGTGIDSIDLKAAAERNIIVANAPGTNANAVADLAMGLIIASAREIVSADKRLRQGFWGPIMGYDVFGKTLGVLGLGQIGRGLIKRARAFEMNILGYDVVHDKNFEHQYGVKPATLEEILSSSDFISVHLPLLESTRNIISKPQLEMMKPAAFLINTCRGGIVDEEALYDALVNKRIAGAALDVFNIEPPVDSAFFKLSNVICTPHMGGYTHGAMALTSEIVAENIVNVLQGKPPLYEVKS